jgi:hypothetical protein
MGFPNSQLRTGVVAGKYAAHSKPRAKLYENYSTQTGYERAI